jgi:hypothetical protein
LANRKLTGGCAVGTWKGSEEIVEGMILIDDKNRVSDCGKLFWDKCITTPRASG